MQNTIVCIFKVDDIEKANSFTEVPQVNNTQNESGMIGAPEVLFLNEL